MKDVADVFVPLAPVKILIKLPKADTRKICTLMTPDASG